MITVRLSVFWLALLSCTLQAQITLLQEPQKTALFKLLAKTGIQHDGTLHDIVEKTQQAWLRPAGTERWHVTEKYEDRKAELLPLCGTVGLIQEQQAQRTAYDYAGILGGTVTRMRIRFAHFLKLWEQGKIQCKQLVWLVGNRKLDPQVEPESLLTDPYNKELPFDPSWAGPIPTNETEAARMTYNQSKGAERIPIPAVFVDTPQHTNPDGIFSRPRTDDTVKHWLTMYTPQRGSILMLSNQPYAGYQLSVLQTLLSGFYIECAASESQETSSTVLLDTLARWLYQEEQRSLQTPDVL